MYLLRKRLGWKTKRFVGGQDPDFDDFCFAALFGIGYVRHRGEGTQLHGDGYARGAFRRLGMHDLVTLDGAIVALRPPVSEKILHRINRTRFPELISPGSVAGDQRAEKTLCGLFLRVVAEGEPQKHNGDQRKRRDSEGHGSRFIWFSGRWIEKRHSVVSCPASVGIKAAVVQRHPSAARQQQNPNRVSASE